MTQSIPEIDNATAAEREQALAILADPDWQHDAATEVATDDINSVYVRPLSASRQLEAYYAQGCLEALEVHDRRSLTEIVSEFELADNQSHGELLSAWGLDGTDGEEAVESGYAGECSVWVEPNYYPGHCNAPRGARARYMPEPDEDRPWYAEYAQGDPHWGGGVLVFPDYATAARYVDEYYNAPSEYDGIRNCNVLSHGQAGADTLTIIAA